MAVSAVGERFRQRQLSANEKSIEAFFTRQLPPGWAFTANEKILVLRRKAPVYALAVAKEDYLTQSKAVMLARAKKEAKRRDCQISFRVERHDDIAIVRQKLRLYQNVQQAIAEARRRLRVDQRCFKLALEECAQLPGEQGEAASEYLRTRAILAQKSEATPFYRVGTLYLYPLKNQCVTRELDWYFINADFPEGAEIFPIEAREEIQVILRNLGQLKLAF